MAHVVENDHDAAHGEREIFDDEFARESEHREMRLEHELWRGNQHRKGSEKMKNQGSMSRLGKDITKKRDTDGELKPPKKDIPYSVCEEWKARVDNVVHWIKAREFECREPKEDDAERNTQQRDTFLKCLFAVHEDSVAQLSVT